MIAWAGAERLALGLTDTLAAAPHARWSLHDVAGPAGSTRAEPAEINQPRTVND
jgi:N6-L-threonylcarbamoyladenine synthase